MIRPEEIPIFIKKLGTDVLAYIVNLSAEEAKKLLSEGYTLSKQQQDALTALIQTTEAIQRNAIHQNDPESYTFFYLSNLIQPSSRHAFNEWREQAGGALCVPLSDDDVIHSLTALAIEAYPALLMSSSEGFRNKPLGFAGFPPINYPGNTISYDAVLKDASLSKLFPNRGKNAFEITGGVTTSTGRGSIIQLEFFASVIIGASYILAQIKEQLSPEAFLKCVREVILMVRRAADGEVVMVPALIGFRNVAMPSRSELELPFGKIKDIRPGVLQLLPYDARPSFLGDKSLLGFLLQIEYPYRVTVNKQLNTEFTSELKATGYYEAQKRTENIIEKVGLTLSLGLNRETPLGANQSWMLILDPLSFGANVSWRTNQLSAVPHYIVTNADYEPIKDWAKRVDLTDTQSIRIAIRRILSAVSHRHDPVDGFVDAIIAWENVFGGKGELTFRVSMAMACLLETQLNERLRLQKELAELYDTRSFVVHGVKDLSAPEAISRRDKALNLIIECLRRLYKDYPHLIADKERSKKILLRE